MSKTDNIIQDAGVYSGSLLLTQFVTMAAAVITRHFLGPVQMGVWSLVQVILNYSEYAALGTLTAVTLEIPYYYGKGDGEKAASIKNTVFSFSVISSLFVACGVLIYAFYRRQALKEEFFYGLLFAAGLILLQKLNGLLISLLRAYKHFSLAGRQMIYSALVNAFLIAALSSRFRLYGFMTAMALSFVFNIVFILKNADIRFRLAIKWAELVSLVRFGLPPMAIAMFSTFFETIDRLIISRYLGFEALGLYSIALMAYAYINSVPNAIGIVMIPNIQEKFGRTENKSDLKGYLQKSDLVYSAFIPALIALGWFLAPLAIHGFLPKFTGGILAMRLLMLSGYFVALSQAYSQFIYVIRRHMALLPMFAFSCSVSALLNWIAVRQGAGIEGVAAATTLAMLAHFTLIQAYASSHVFSFIEMAKNYVVAILKFILMTVLLFAIDRWVRLPNPFINPMLQTGIFMAAYSPFLIDAEKKFHFISLLRERIGKR